jgi:hypothetical protein
VVEVVAASTRRSEEVVLEVLEAAELLVVVQSNQIELESLELVQLPVPL